MKLLNALNIVLGILKLKDYFCPPVEPAVEKARREADEKFKREQEEKKQKNDSQ